MDDDEKKLFEGEDMDETMKRRRVMTMKTMTMRTWMMKLSKNSYAKF